MRKNKLLIMSILSILLVLSLAACSQQSAQAPIVASPANNSSLQQDVQPTEEVVAPEEAVTSDENETADTVEFVDGLGRTVNIPKPEKLERVYADSTNSLVLLYILAPDMLTASPTVFTEDDAPYVPSYLFNLPTYGTLSGANGVLDYEALKAADVQLLVSTGVSSDVESTDELQEQLGIPIIVFSTHLDQLPDSFTRLGKALGREEEAKTVVDYLNGVVEKVTTAVANVPEDERPTLYYAEGKDGLATEPANSDRSIVFNMCGTKNVATVEALSGFGQSAVSMEAILNWNPEVIVVQGYTDAYGIITSNTDWANIDAVKNGRVYQMPSNPFGWADRPPGANRYIGLLWLADLLYPDVMNIDLVDEVIDYYHVIYHVDITPADVEKLLANSMPQ